mgnify:CR=1 FL=1
MKIKTVSVRYERKVNLGDFNSIMGQCALFAELDPGDNEDTVMKALWEMAKENVKAAILPAVKEHNLSLAEIKEMYLGLPVEVRDQILADPYLEPFLAEAEEAEAL